jgi:5-methylthioribose kinase
VTAPAAENAELAAHLARRGLIASPADLRVLPLAGGVSNDVVAVSAPGLDAVVKQALGKLRVAEEWLADPARLATEGRALRLAGALLPGSVPRVLDLADGYLVIERAPRDWHTWKDDLLAGSADAGIGSRLGNALGQWQRLTLSNAEVAGAFGSLTAFNQLRVDPFHRTVAQRHPDLAGVIGTTIETMEQGRACLVHGDYTPKNVLVSPAGDGLWVIDWEVAHVGDPTFDPASTLGHLLLKTVHCPAAAAGYSGVARAFLAGLDAGRDGLVNPDSAQLIRQVGCLLLARVDGKSPAEYLDADGKARTRALARRLLTAPPATITDAWELLA